MPIKQFYNSRTKQWVKIDTDKKGGILETSNEKFPNVPVKDKQPKEPEPKDPEPKDPEPKNDSDTFLSRIFGG